MCFMSFFSFQLVAVVTHLPGDNANVYSAGDLTINDLVKWMTGTKTVRVHGFPKKFSITFVHGCDAGCRCRPTTSTCDLLLKMPVQSPVCTGIWHWFSIFDAMVEMMSSGLQNGVFIMVQFYPWFNFYSPLVF